MIIGRDSEIRRLRKARESEYSEFVAVYGRRRIGKTFLIKEAFDYSFAFSHSGLAKGDMKMQLSEFAKSMVLSGLIENRRYRPKNWSDAFFELECALDRLPPGKKVVFLDEVPWMDTRKSNFVGALEHFWNGWCTMRKDIVLIVCGSATSWIVSKILKDHGGLHNRLTDQIRLRPFTLRECEMMAQAKGLSYSRQQILDAYMILGGVPFYWEKLERGKSVDQNVDQLYFGSAAPFNDEFDQLYASLFKHPEGHVAVVTALGTKKCGMTREEIIEQAHLDDGGAVSKVLSELENCGFVRSYTLPGRKVRGSVYQLIDNFTLFYFKFMSGGRNRRSGEWLSQCASTARRVWNGLAFERVCLEHVDQLKRALGISGVRTVEYSWSRRGGDDREGAQIDLLIKRADNAVNICEMKYASEAYVIDAEESRGIAHRREAFIADESYHGAVFVTLVSPYGAVHNAAWNEIQNEVTLNDLFAE